MGRLGQLAECYKFYAGYCHLTLLQRSRSQREIRFLRVLKFSRPIPCYCVVSVGGQSEVRPINVSLCEPLLKVIAEVITRMNLLNMYILCIKLGQLKNLFGIILASSCALH